MFIQKVEIRTPINDNSQKIKYKTKTKSKLTHSSSSCNLSSNQEFNIINNLPYILSNDTKLKKDSMRIKHLSLFDLRNVNNNQGGRNTDIFAGYKPKRLLKIKKCLKEEQLYDYRHLPLNENKVFKTIERNQDNHIFNQHLINFSLKKSNEFFEEDNLQLKKYSSRSSYLLNMEKHIQYFGKLKSSNNALITNKSNIYDDLTYKIIKIMNAHKTYFLEKLYQIDEESLNFNKNMTSISNNNNENNSISNIMGNNNNCSNKIISSNYDIGKMIIKEINLFCDFLFLINKLFEFLLNEINIAKNENFK